MVDGGFRAGKPIALKDTVDTALTNCPDVATVLVYNRAGLNVQKPNNIS